MGEGDTGLDYPRSDHRLPVCFKPYFHPVNCTMKYPFSEEQHIILHQQDGIIHYPPYPP